MQQLIFYEKLRNFWENCRVTGQHLLHLAQPCGREGTKLFCCVTACWAAPQKKLARGLVTEKRICFCSPICNYVADFWDFCGTFQNVLFLAWIRLSCDRATTEEEDWRADRIDYRLVDFFCITGNKCKHYFARFFLQVVVAFCFLIPRDWNERYLRFWGLLILLFPLRSI